MVMVGLNSNVTTHAQLISVGIMKEQNSIAVIIMHNLKKHCLGKSEKKQRFLFSITQ